MVSHFGSFKKKSVRLGCVLLNRGFHTGADLRKEKSIYSPVSSCGRLLSLLRFALSLSPRSVVPGPLSQGISWGVPELWSPWAKELPPFMRNNKALGVLPKDQLLPLFLSYSGQSCLPGEPLSRREGTARWEMGRKGKPRMWLTEANKK